LFDRSFRGRQERRIAAKIFSLLHATRRRHDHQNPNESADLIIFQSRRINGIRPVE
jgi:hypothetical protein